MLTYSDLPFDVIHHLCSMIWALDGKGLLALSLVDRRTRSACIPLLFKEIIVDRQWGETSVPWDGFEVSVEALLANESITGAVKCTLVHSIVKENIDISLRSLHFEPWVRHPEKSPIPSRFFDLLFSLPSLSELGVILQLEYLGQFEEEFNCLDDTLPRSGAKLLHSLRYLSIPSPEWMFIGECSPNITYLDVRSSTRGCWPVEGLSLDIVRLGKSHPDLKSLHCEEIALSKHVREIAENLPQIRDLGLYGQFEEYAQDDTRCIMDHIEVYNILHHLKQLSLPGADGLGMGFCPPRCGNAYQTNPGLAEKVERERDEVIKRLMDGFSSEVIARQGSTLCEVTVGERDYTSELWEKGEDGKLFASKSVERSRTTQRVIAVSPLEKRPLT